MAIDRATFAGTDLDQAMASMARLELERAPTLSMFFDRSQEMSVRTNDNAIIDNYHFDVDGAAASTIPVATPASMKADFQTPKEFSLSQQTWKIDQGGENSFKMYLSDIVRSSRGRQRILDGAARMRNNAVIEREDNLVSYLDGLAAYTTAAPASATDLPLLDNSGANGNAGKIYHTTVGVAANTIDDETGAIGGDTSAKREATATALLDTLATLRTRIRRRNVGMNEQGRVIGVDPGTFMFLAPPEVGRAYNEALKILKVEGEELNRNLYRDMGAFSESAFEFQINNLASFSTTALPTPAAAGDGYDCYLLTNKAVQYAEDVVDFWSQEPKRVGGVNAGNFNSYHQWFWWGRKMVNSECIIKVTIRSA